MANFLRQKYKEKPQIWGSFESVQRSLFKNAEKIGIDPQSLILALPIWESAGTIIHNYAHKTPAYIHTSSYMANNRFVSNAESYNYEINFGNVSSLEKYSNRLSILCRYKDVNSSISSSIESILIRRDRESTGESFAISFTNGLLRVLINASIQSSWTTTHDRTLPKSWRNWNTYAVIYDGVTQSEYQNNQLLGSLAVSGAIRDNDNNLYINGCSYPNNGYSCVGEYDYVLYINDFIKNNARIKLTDNPYQLWQRQPDVYFSVAGTSTGGTTYQATCATSWFIRVVSEKQTAWNILNLLSQGSDWKIFKNAALNSSYKILSDTTQESSFKIISDTVQESSYRILHRSIKDLSYMILSKLSQESAWQILLSSLTEQSLAWKILNSEEKETSWQIMLSGLLEQALSWKIFNSETQNSSFNILNNESQDSSFKILNDSDAISKWKISNTETKNSAYNILHDSNAISAWKISISHDANATWNILNEKTANSTWKIKHDNIIDTTWKILNVNDIELSYSIKHLIENNSDWKIFNTETIDSSWSLLSDIIPSALYEFAQSQRTFVFNQAQRTFIFFR